MLGGVTGGVAGVRVPKVECGAGKPLCKNADFQIRYVYKIDLVRSLVPMGGEFFVIHKQISVFPTMLNGGVDKHLQIAQTTKRVARTTTRIVADPFNCSHGFFKSAKLFRC